MRMKPCAYTKQSLLDHSIGSYEDLNKLNLFDDNYYRLMAKRLKNFGISLSANEIKDMVKDLVILHDIGKAAEYYQEQFDEECNTLNGGKPSFLYHEIGSALFFYYDYEANREVRELLALATLNHLNAIRGIWSYSYYKPYGFNDKMLTLEEYGNKLLEELKKRGLLSKNVKNVRARNYSFDEFLRMAVSLIKRNIKYKHLKLYTLFLAPVIVGDNLNSSSRLDGEKSLFIKKLIGEKNENTSL